MQKKYRQIYSLAVILFFLCLYFSVSVQAAGLLNPDASSKLNKQAEITAEGAGFAQISNSGEGIGQFAAVVINAFFGLLGIIFIVLILLAGYNWMTAQGEESKVNRAKDSLKAAIIGLVIIVAAYAITYFVFANLDEAMSGFGWSG